MNGRKLWILYGRTAEQNSVLYGHTLNKSQYRNIVVIVLQKLNKLQYCNILVVVLQKNEMLQKIVKKV